jgi:alanyl-tRNA synthetase
VATARTAALVSGEGQPVPVVVARSSDLEFDMGGWLKSAIGRLGGRGGGRAGLAQGGLDAAPEAIADDFRESIEKVARGPG